MGQKANPISLQLGTKKSWTIEFSEKKPRDVGLITEQSMQILKFIKRYLECQTISLQNFKLYYTENTITIFLSIFSFASKNKLNTHQNHMIKLKKKGVLITDKDCWFLNLTNPVPHLQLAKLVASISKFTGGRKIVFKVSIANKHLNLTSQEKKAARRKMLILRRYKRQDFFIESFDTLFSVSRNKNFASVLLDFLKKYVKKFVRARFFLRFLRKTLSLLIKDTKYKTSGIKIKVKGRLNGANRSKSFEINVGRVPIHSERVDLDYVSSQTQNKNGSYGIKIWTVKISK